MKSRQPLEFSKTVPIPLGMTYKMRVRIEELSSYRAPFLIALAKGGELFSAHLQRRQKHEQEAYAVYF